MKKFFFSQIVPYACRRGGMYSQALCDTQKVIRSHIWMHKTILSSFWKSKFWPTNSFLVGFKVLLLPHAISYMAPCEMAGLFHFKYEFWRFCIRLWCKTHLFFPKNSFLKKFLARARNFWWFRKNEQKRQILANFHIFNGAQRARKCARAKNFSRNEIFGKNRCVLHQKRMQNIKNWQLNLHLKMQLFRKNHFLLIFEAVLHIFLRKIHFSKKVASSNEDLIVNF